MFRSQRILLTPSRGFFSPLSRSSFSTAITASMVKELREVTGAPMMECKKALSDPEVNGNIQKGIDWLRAKGIAKATSQTTRKSIEGLIGIYQSATSARGITLVEVNSETDFVSRNSDFQKFVTSVILTCNMNSAEAAAGEGLDVDKVLDLQSVVGNEQNMTLKHILGDITSSIRERMVLRRAMNLPLVPQTISGVYVHGKLSTENLLPSNVDGSLEMGREAAVVTLKVDSAALSDENQQKLSQIAKRLAMHVVAAKPAYLRVEDVPQSTVESETAIFKEQTLASPPKNMAMLDKIVSGKVNKRLQEISLSGQTHMAVEGGPVIEKYLQGLSKEIGVEVSLNSFTRWALGQTHTD